MKILVDMNLSPSWCEFLRSIGHDAVHWSAVGEIWAPDSEILLWACERSWVVLTNDLDFGAILAASGGSAPSVLQVRAQDVAPEALGSMIQAALRDHHALLSSGALLAVLEDRIRVRLLPIR